jgi:hypothetical protein
VPALATDQAGLGRRVVGDQPAWGRGKVPVQGSQHLGGGLRRGEHRRGDAGDPLVEPGDGNLGRGAGQLPEPAPLGQRLVLDAEGDGGHLGGLRRAAGRGERLEVDDDEGGGSQPVQQHGRGVHVGSLPGR